MDPRTSILFGIWSQEAQVGEQGSETEKEVNTGCAQVTPTLGNTSSVLLSTLEHELEHMREKEYEYEHTNSYPSLVDD